MSKYYIARDKDNNLFAYYEKPIKQDVEWRAYSTTGFEEIDNILFPEVKWTDKEPKVLTIEESPWVRVEERLPNDNEIVFALWKNKETNELSYGTNGLLNGKWITYSGNWELIAWMSIPEFKE